MKEAFTRLWLLVKRFYLRIRVKLGLEVRVGTDKGDNPVQVHKENQTEESSSQE